MQPYTESYAAKAEYLLNCDFVPRPHSWLMAASLCKIWLIQLGTSPSGASTSVGGLARRRSPAPFAEGLLLSPLVCCIGAAVRTIERQSLGARPLDVE
mmetsp:Transcript_55102/g.129350  ORF Transcript_55102/g.129350 Transcript_55102/m.129350 type:complete len:98 (-) Transcript_55102:308-601(-)